MRVFDDVGHAALVLGVVIYGIPTDVLTYENTLPEPIL